jgi:hypothetical protein
MSSSSLSPSRVAIAILCAGALAFACGPRTHSEAASTTSLATAATIFQQGTAHAHDSARLASAIEVNTERTGVRFALHITNATKKHVELAFPNGQTHEFVVVDSVGREIWRWSSSRLFTQALQNKLLGSGDSMEYSEQWAHPAQHGRYTVIATLNSTNFPVQERANFVLP